MKLLLKDFQTERTEEFVKALRLASRLVREDDGMRWAVSLASPTGSGKTVMVTAAIEQLLTGDAENPPDPDATFLWITDQPELNEQTRQRMLETSTVLGPSDLVVLDAAFDHETFPPGKVYFLNIQKVGRDKSLVTVGDDRTFSLWETITNTVRERPGSFYVVIDEAHRGMQEKPKARTEAATIVQKFVKGSEGEIPAVPLIVGISATPERFNVVIEGTGRVARQVVVPPEEVRASGLLKEAILLYHPTEDQPSDMTMLRASVRSWKAYAERWVAYCAEEEEPTVRPILVVQVQDASGKKLSATDLGEALRAIEAEAGPLPDEAFAHAFQEGAPVEMDGRSIRYLAPSAISADPDVQVVFFKTSLNTGWDCPRAEVMMSFRKALDATLIAQLVGRMVRTPLARRVDADEHLNTVALYLPHYDAGQLEKVIARLSSPDPDEMLAVEVRKGEDSVTLSRAPGSEAAFQALAEIPSYVVPGGRRTSQVARLMKLARRLANDDLLGDAPEQATALMLDTLRGEYARLKDTEPFKKLVDEQGKLDVAAVLYRFGEDRAEDARAERFDVAAENVEDLFEASGRKLGEGLHKAWWRARVEEDAGLKVQAKLELSALCADPAVLKRVEQRAQEQTQAWLGQYHKAISALPEGERQAYDAIRGLASEPEQTTLTHPDVLEVKRDGSLWEKHLYVDEKGRYQAKLGGWEARVIEEEIAREDVVGWLRNVDRKDWALRVPYRSGERYASLYPDFLVVRREGEGLVVDVLEPHNIELGDAVDKAIGFAQFAAKHAFDFGRIELIIIDGEQIKRLDLRDEGTRNQVLALKTRDALRLLFK